MKLARHLDDVARSPAYAGDGLTGAAEDLRTSGFTVLRGVLSPLSLGEVEATLDGLFANVDRLASGRRRDLAMRDHAAVEPGSKILEISRPLLLRPDLRRSAVFRECRRMARALDSRLSAYAFDHAIYKLPNSEAPTEWHQDEAFAESQRARSTLHFWIPLQEVGVEHGCMHYVPGSHRWGLLQHERCETVDGDSTLRVRLPDAARAVAVPVAAGDVVVHLPRTLHCASGNSVPRTRKAWVLHFGAFGVLSKLHPAELSARAVKWLTRGSPRRRGK